MATTYTGTSAITGPPAQTGITGLVKQSYDRYIEFALRSQPLIRGIVDRRPVQQAFPGSSVVLQNYVDLSAQTTALTENVDPDAVALSNLTNVTITLNEYGNAVLETRALAELALSDIDPAIANIVAYNMADSIDQLVQSTIRSNGTNVRLAGGASTSYSATSSVTSTSYLKGEDIRLVTSKMKALNAMPRFGSLYGCYMHPEVSFDVKSEAGASGAVLQGSFEDIRKYTESQVGNIINSVAGVIHGAYIVESPRMYNATDGASSTRNYRTHFFGQQAVAEAVAIEPGIVMGPITDRLMRARPVGWYGLLGWNVYRQNALYRVESTSSINKT